MAKRYFIAFGAIFVALALLLAGCTKPVTPPVPNPSATSADAAGLKAFTSYDEIYDFLKTTGSSYSYRNGMAERDTMVKTVGATPTMAPSAADSGTQSAADYSQTNVQVAGVDEADFVKNDGKYIYVAKNEYSYGSSYNPFGSSQTGKVKILDAYPAVNMKQVGEISIEGSVQEIFIYKDKLVVFGSIYVPYYRPTMDVQCMGCIRPPYYSQNFAFMRVYDVSDKASPKLVKRIEVKGDYRESRMIGGKVYAVFSDYANYEYPVPLYRVDGTDRQIAPTEVRYFDWPDSSYNYNIFTGISLDDLSQEESRKVVLMGASQNLFVSMDNMYVSYTTYDYYDPQWKVYNDVFSAYFDDDTKLKMAEIDARNISDWRKEKLKSQWAFYFIQNKIYNPLDFSVDSALREELQAKLQDEMGKVTEQPRSEEKTAIHKFALDGSFTYGGEASVPGHVLNQFSMDEYNGNFRIATTEGRLSRNNPTTSNNVYVIDSGMKVVGKLEGLAPGESIYSARFMGNRAYVVTFKKVDPLFVIDLSNPASPQVLGKLKIPGYSSYLHPYNETMLIGLGKGAEAAEEGDFAWYQGVKLSLFDVSDVEHPKEVAKYEIGDRGTDSYALNDHKAFLFSKEKNLLVIPVKLAKIDPLKYPNGVEANTYGDYVFQGAYVFSITPEDGFSLRGTISHADEEAFMKSGEYYYGSNDNVQRSLYMDNYLYTVSGMYVKANDLYTLAPLSSVQIGNSTNYGGYGIESAPLAVPGIK